MNPQWEIEHCPLCEKQWYFLPVERKRRCPECDVPTVADKPPPVEVAQTIWGEFAVGGEG